VIDVQTTAAQGSRNDSDVTRVSLGELVRLKNSVRLIKRPRGSAVKAPLTGGSNAPEGIDAFCHTGGI